jgi:nitrogen regulatory protein P-II 1
MSFRKVTAIFRPYRLEAVEDRLRELAVPGISVTKVTGYGEYANYYTSDLMSSSVRVEVFIGQHRAEEIAKAIMEAAFTGLEGDGIVAILPVESVYHIRTKQECEHDVC